ncbi:XRE family transcriptional regulator [Arcanobacterium hippocoleae]
MTLTYYSRSDFAKYIGVAVDTLDKYKLPEPDVVIGLAGRGTKGWKKTRLTHGKLPAPERVGNGVNRQH